MKKENYIKSYFVKGELNISRMIDDYYDYVGSIIKDDVDISSEEKAEIIHDVFYSVIENQDDLDMDAKFSAYLEDVTRKMLAKRFRNNKKIFIMIASLLLVIVFIICFIIILVHKNNNAKSEESVEAVSYDNNLIVSENTTSNNVEQKPEIDSKTTDWNLILVNKDSVVPDDYDFELKDIDSASQVDSRIAEAAQKMLSDAKSQGLRPVICSSYRSTDTQESLYRRKVNEYINLGFSSVDAEREASYWVTFPGSSEHEVGLALDIVSQNYQILDQNQENTDVQKWLVDNCQNYGFVLRYPTDKKDITKINYEPWHYRYVGVENAKFMKEKGFCLEEYIQYLKQFE